jgi:predicted aspartyl protease
LEAALAKLTGSVDDLGRPVVRIEVPGRDGCLAVVDTGFNRSLLLTAAEARTMGFTILMRTEDVELGTSLRVTVREATGILRWLDRDVEVRAFISDEPVSDHRPDTARALLGTEMLRGCLLLVDFANGVVEIETQD